MPMTIVFGTPCNDTRRARQVAVAPYSGSVRTGSRRGVCRVQRAECPTSAIAPVLSDCARHRMIAPDPLIATGRANDERAAGSCSTQSETMARCAGAELCDASVA